MQPTERFSDRAQDYARHRPAYPEAAIDAVLDGLGDPAALAAADVGAGTGISSRLLADRGVRVAAVEPNAAMRAAAAPHPRVTWLDGTAERTGLPDAAADLVLCAQAFHWFEPRSTLAEFRRVLRPGARVALVWNVRDRTDPATDAYSAAVDDAMRSGEAASPGIDPHALDGVTGLRPLAPLVCPWGQSLDGDGLVGRFLSASYVPKSGPGHQRLVEGIRALHARFADPAGRIRIVYRTLVLRAVRT
jgi:SAM-dependent methyltransferase